MPTRLSAAKVLTALNIRPDVDSPFRVKGVQERIDEKWREIGQENRQLDTRSRTKFALKIARAKGTGN
jgi:hypothetical protein